MSQLLLEALKDGHSIDFSFNKDPRCPHCGEPYCIQDEQAWRLYNDDDHHDVDCPNCELEFKVITHISYTFSTDEQEE